VSEERQRIEGQAGSAPNEAQKEAAAEASKEAASQEAAEEKAEATEEKPKPKRTRRKKKAEESTVDSPQSTEAKDEDAEEAKESADEEEAEAEAAEADGEPEPEDEKAQPKSRRGAEQTAGRRQRSRRRTADEVVTVRAKARYVRCAPRKARLVVDHIRGKSVEEALAILTFTPRGASRDVLKLLNSAVANAESNHELGPDELRIAKVYVDEGPTLKRYRPRALGRATRIRKRTSHMTIHLTNQDAA
jgi:ribosomal protein L22